jgi:hypothetical protein
MVAPYSGAMLDTVALSARDRLCTPSPKNSTNLPTTPLFLSMATQVSTRSVAVASCPNYPMNLNPTTLGNTIDIFYPIITASASIPPTPHPITPRPLIMVV